MRKAIPNGRRRACRPIAATRIETQRSRSTPEPAPERPSFTAPRSATSQKEHPMIFRQILHPATGCASYVFGCTGKRTLAVVDPHHEHVDEYLAIAQLAQSAIVAIIETHVQADHLSGAPELATRTGAPIYLH